MTTTSWSGCAATRASFDTNRATRPGCACRRACASASASVRPQVRQELDATNAEIEKVLTPEQRTKFEALQLQHRRQRMNRRGAHGMAPGLPPAPPPDVH